MMCSHRRMYLFLELMTGGELFDRIVDQGHFTEEQAKDVSYKLLSALDFMHKQGVAHRDLKPENMLMTDKSATAEVCGLSSATGVFLGPLLPFDGLARSLTASVSGCQRATGQDHRFWFVQVL